VKKPKTLVKCIERQKEWFAFEAGADQVELTTVPKVQTNKRAANPIEVAASSEWHENT